MAVPSRVDGRSALTTQLPLPVVKKDSDGQFIAITCGNITGQLYCAKLSQSKGGLSKCVLVKNK